jgi:hypothetical protein
MPDTQTFPSPAMKILILASLLVISLIATVYGYTSAATMRQKMTAFAADSVTTTGTVTNWQITNVARSPDYWLDISFASKDGATHNVSASVDKPLFDNQKIGGSVEITYVRSRPEWFYVADEAPSDKQAAGLDWLFRLGALASLLCAIGLAFRLFGGGGGGANPRENLLAMEAPPAAPASRSTRPAGFGKRESAR